MAQVPTSDVYVTTNFRTLGWAGAILFTLAPPAFLYEVYLLFFTTAMEENASIPLLAGIALILSFASVPMMLAGRRLRYSSLPTLAGQE